MKQHTITPSQQGNTTRNITIPPVKEHIKAGFQALVSFYRWLVSGALLINITRQIVMTGGNVAESAFLLATLWVITNAVAHTLLTWCMSAHSIELINYLSVIAFSALPELIIIPVVIICLSHWVVAINHKSKISGTWAILYTIPALFFLVLTIIAITRFVSTGGTNFIPASGPELVIRCLSGWFYAVINMLNKKLGEPYYASQLNERDTEISQLKARIETLVTEYSTEKQNLLASHTAEIEKLALLLKTQSQQVNLLAERASTLELRGLENYQKVVEEWLNRGVKTVTIEEIMAVTGHSKRQINRAKLETDRRNSNRIRVSSVVEWLKIAPLPETPIPGNNQSNGHTNGYSNGHLIDGENDTPPFGLPVYTAALE